MNLLPFAQRLQDMGVGLLGDSIFVNMIPSEAPEGVLLRNPLAGTKIDYELPGYYKTTFRLIARAEDYSRGEALIASAIAALTIQDEQVDTMHVRFSRPITKPVVFPLSKGNLLEFMTEFEVVFDE